MSVLGDRVKKRRTEMGIALAELARRVDISKGYLYAIESGEAQSPSAEILFKIANELDTTIADLLGEEPEQPRSADIPRSLLEFAEEADLTDADIQMLARIEYRGKRPQTIDDWRFIYESIKRSLR
jgi:transcriptional regulator with XRE-family HTH domain